MTALKTLRKCFNRYGCDRGSIRHGYDRVYGSISPPIRMLEVGVMKGAGLKAWLDFFPQTEIVCMDIIDPPEIVSHPRITWHKADSRTIKLTGKFDLIIDDGAHDPDTQRQTFENLFPLCRGVYFIEDVWPMDAINAKGRKLFNHWAAKGWLDKSAHTMKKYTKLLNTISAHNLKRHDLRRGHSPNSYLFEISR